MTRKGAHWLEVAARHRDDATPKAVPIQCLVPPELPGAQVAALESHFADWPSISVQLDRRGRERRRPGDRRARGAEHEKFERRGIRNRYGRRVADRRATLKPVDSPPPLPAELIPDPSLVSFWKRGLQSVHVSEGAEILRLVVRFQAGDEEAFPEIYERYFDRLYAYLLAALRDRHEAEDASQEVFIRALRALPRYEFRGAPFEAWLFRIARNYALNHKERADPVVVEDPVEVDRWRDGADAADSLQWMSDADLLSFIDRLPLAQRQVIVLRYMVGFEWDTVAAILDRSAGAVRQLEQRAFASLRARLEAVGGGREQGRVRFAMRRIRRSSPVTSARRGVRFGRLRAA